MEFRKRLPGVTPTGSSRPATPPASNSGPTKAMLEILTEVSERWVAQRSPELRAA